MDDMLLSVVTTTILPLTQHTSNIIPAPAHHHERSEDRKWEMEMCTYL